MIDLHCHILPALDDGAVDLEDSIAMARQAEADGISRICATPHIRHDHDVAAHEVAARVETVNDALAEAGVRSRVLTGGEVAEANVSGLSDDELRLVSLGGSGRWVLLEPGPGAMSESLVEAVEALGARGFRALIAHPERHLDAEAPERLARLVERHALVQVTAASFTEPGAEFVLALAGRGLIHLVASDAHSAHFGRQVRISHAIGALATVTALTPHLDWIAHTAPEAIIRGEDVSPPYPAG